ncbi:MAG: hypothetical protein ACFE96_07345 [Candidatus Hermodarchaeota archaeon]
MEEFLPSLKDMLKEAINIQINVSDFSIKMIVKKEVKGNLAEPEEVIIMLKMYGGLQEDIPMDITIDNQTQTINLKFQNEDNFKEVVNIFETIWDNAVDLLFQAIASDFSRIKNIPNIDD